MAKEININQVVTAKDLVAIFRFSERTAERRLRAARLGLKRGDRGNVTLSDFCTFFNLSVAS